MIHGTSGHQCRARPRPGDAGAEGISLVPSVDIKRALSNGNLMSCSLPPVRLGKGETAGGGNLVFHVFWRRLSSDHYDAATLP